MIKFKIILLISVLLTSCNSKSERLRKAVKEYAKRPFNCDYISNQDKDSLLKDSNRFIAHASGGLSDGQGNEIKYTNTFEGLQQSIKRGYKLIELDLIITKDNKIVASHDWDIWRHFTKTNILLPTEKEFNSLLILNKYKPLSSTKILEFFLENPDTFLVTDKISNFKLLKSTFPTLLDRIIIETFSIDDYIEALKLGLNFPMLSIEAAGGEKILKLAIQNKVPLIALHTSNINNWKKYLHILRQQGTCIFSFSTNEAKFIKENMNEFVFGFYSDFWNIHEQKCDAGICNTY